MHMHVCVCVCVCYIYIYIYIYIYALPPPPPSLMCPPFHLLQVEKHTTAMIETREQCAGEGGVLQIRDALTPLSHDTPNSVR